MVNQREIEVAIVEHLKLMHPAEACGVVTTTGRIWQMTNVANDPRSEYQFDEAETLELYESLDAHGDEIAIVYHSHPFGTTVPSQTDIHAAREQCFYLIGAPTVGTWHLGAWKYVEGRAEACDLDSAFASAAGGAG